MQIRTKGKTLYGFTPMRIFLFILSAFLVVSISGCYLPPADSSCLLKIDIHDVIGGVLEADSLFSFTLDPVNGTAGSNACCFSPEPSLTDVNRKEIIFNSQSDLFSGKIAFRPD